MSRPNLILRRLALRLCRPTVSGGLSLLSLSLCALACSHTPGGGYEVRTRTLVASLAPVGGGHARGRATLTEQQVRGVSPVAERAAAISIAVSGLAPGRHGVAVLAGGCEGRDHLNPTLGLHGERFDVRGHAGDLGNLEVDAAGDGHLELGGLTALGVDAVFGRALVVLSGPDDGRTQPDGGAGPPVLCGVFRD